MGQRIFISYRRDDEAGTAGRLYDYLVHFTKIPRDHIFKDVDNIVPGTNFVTTLTSEVVQCQLMLAIVGRRWINATDEAGRRRLEDPCDFVRIELEAALNRGIPLIPLWIDGAQIPGLHELPDSLSRIREQQGIEVRNANFESDVRRLIKAIEWHEAHRPSPQEDAAVLPKVIPALEPKPTPTPRPLSIGPPPIAPPPKVRETTENDLLRLGGLYYMAEAGDAQYLYEVGCRLQSGHGIPRNLGRALTYFQRAARAGYGRAHVRIAEIQRELTTE
jgi:hypothetical protein